MAISGPKIWVRENFHIALGEGYWARRPPFRRADAATIRTRTVLRQRFVHAALELGVEAENARIHERQDLRQYNAGDLLRLSCPPPSPAAPRIFPSGSGRPFVRDLRYRFRVLLVSAGVCCLWRRFRRPCLRIQKFRSWRTRLSARGVLFGIQPKIRTFNQK